MQIQNSGKLCNPPARRNGNSANCSNCGEPLNPKRGSRRQRFCSYRCRDEARRNRNFATFATTRPAIPRSVQNNVAASTACVLENRDQASGIGGPRKVIMVELVARRTWRDVISVDGVRCQVTRLGGGP